MTQSIKRLILATLVSLCWAGLSWADFTVDDLMLVQIRLNNKLNYNSELLQIEDKIYLPAKQIADIIEESIEYDRNSRVLSFTSRKDNLPIRLDGTNQTIQIGDSTLDKSSNFIFAIQKGYTLKDEILISKTQIETFFDIKINFDEENSVLNITINRPLKALKQERNYLDVTEGEVVQPKKQKLSIRSLQANISSISNASTATNTSAPLAFGNQLNLSLVGDAYGGIYRLGPTFFQQKNIIGLSGFQQSWGKIINDRLGFTAGDSIVQFDPLNMPSSSILGLRLGSPKDLNLKAFDGLSFEGACEANSEILLSFNNQVIARQICRAGRYSLNNIPRLVGSNNNFYQITQNNTDGTQILLREEAIPFYEGLIPAKEKRWNVFVGRPSFTNNLFVSQQADGDQNDFTNGQKLVGGASFKYGLTPKVNIETNISADQALQKPNNFEQLYNNVTFKPIFSDNRFLSGGTASVGINTRFSENFGVSLFGALSNSVDSSPGRIFRAGLGQALYSSYDFRYKNIYNQGSFFYFSPNYYSPLNILSNRMGANVSFGMSLKKQSLGANFRFEDTNIDGKSQGGKVSNKNLLLTHNFTISKYTSISSTVNISRINNDQLDQQNISGRSIVRQKINKRLDATMSVGAIRQTDLLNNTKPFNLTDFTPGGTLYLGKDGLQQMNFGSSFFSDGTRNQFIQGRFRRKSLVYQPSINRFQSPQGDINWLVSNGIFWEKQNGLRLGGEYIFGRASSNSSFNNSSGLSQINQTFRLTMLCTLGFADKKPFIANTQSSGYVKGFAFVDLNNNGIKDAGDVPIKDAQIMFRDKPIKVDPQGEFRIRDVPSGIYEAYLDPLSMPIALVPVIQALKFEVQPGLITELNYTAQLNSGSVSGYLSIKDLDGHQMPVENIVIVARNKDGKEVAYTYTEQNGEYTLSELPPGDYTITLDKLDIEKRHLSIQVAEQKVSIPVKLDEIIEIQNINFEALQTAL